MAKKPAARKVDKLEPGDEVEIIKDPPVVHQNLSHGGWVGCKGVVDSIVTGGQLRIRIEGRGQDELTPPMYASSLKLIRKKRT